MADVSGLRHASMVTVVRSSAMATATAEDTTEVGTMAAAGKRFGGLRPPFFFRIPDQFKRLRSVSEGKADIVVGLTYNPVTSQNHSLRGKPCGRS